MYKLKLGHDSPFLMHKKNCSGKLYWMHHYLCASFKARTSFYKDHCTKSWGLFLYVKNTKIKIIKEKLF
jgi:hypothetical protein